MVKLVMVVVYFIGCFNYDVMSGQYYVCFVVKNVDNFDSYLCQFYCVMELYNDGIYVEEVIDYVLMMKIDEQNMEGGNLLLLYFDDWEYLELFFIYLLVCCVMCWVVLLSKNVSYDVWYLVFDVD